MSKLKPIKEQVIVVTGASSGIGLATALTAAKQGAKVVLAARSEETLRDVVAQIEGAGGEAIFVVADVGSREQVQRVAEAALARFGRIDTWVNDAGVSIYGRLEEVSESDSRRLFDTNFWGVVNGSLVALPLLKQSEGALINVGSEVSEAVVPLQGMYSASKHAVKGFTDALRVELEQVDKAPVSITLIQPTAVDTPFPQNARNYMAKEPKLPTPQIEPQKVADAILDAASHHRRDVKVGAGAVLNTFVAKVAPALGDKLSAKQSERQQYQEPPRNPGGTLHTPGEAGRVKGTGPSPQAGGAGAVSGSGRRS
jgi:short-subunit dehydrogenase